MFHNVKKNYLKEEEVYKMRLSCDKRSRIIELYLNHNLIHKKKYSILCDLAKNEDIFISSRRIFDLVKKWEDSGSVADREAPNRGISNTKINTNQLESLDRAIYKKREITSRTLKHKYRIQASVRTVRRYVRRLGWRKIRTKYCQAVSMKNQVECLKNQIFAKRSMKISTTKFSLIKLNLRVKIG